ncbi:MAG: hypothetical protein M3P27_01255 [Acidobacteriota bacterium]|nr:hypothetical protein [Acidobacteriota bacterium]
MNRHTVQFAIVVLLVAQVAFGQAKTGVFPYGSFGGGPVDTVNLGNLNVHLTVPVFHKAGRGLPFDYDLSYESSVWYPAGSVGSQSWQPITNWGWTAQNNGMTGNVTASATVTYCYDQFGHINGSTTTLSGYTYHDPWGIHHVFPGYLVSYSGACAGTPILTMTSAANDGSGLTLVANWNGSNYVYTTSNLQRNGGTSTTLVTDANGNQISSNSTGVFTDTLGTTALTVAGISPNPVTFTYTSPAGTPATVTMNYSNYNIRTSFGCSGVSEYTATNVKLVSSISLPDGTSYAFTYEPTPNPSYPGYVTGRLSSVTLPTGGSITYTYTGANNGIICKDGSAAGLQRQVSPGGTWTYTRTNPSGTRWTTTATDPAGNQTVLNFQVVYASSPTQRQDGFYETQRQTYQGASTLLQTVNTCYNGAAVPCTTTAITLPIARRTIYNYLPDSAGLQAETDVFYSGLGLVSEIDDYNFGTAAVGPLIRKTLTTYTALGNGIVRPTAVTIQDGGGVQKAYRTFGYDQTTPTSTVGTPQHIAISGARGNLTTVTTQASGSLVYLYQKFTYYDTGTPNSSSDVSTSSSTPGPTTTYNYASGAASCSNSFVTSVSMPLSLTRSTTWDCTGGVPLSTTDENGKVSSTSYNDPYFWRPASATDPLSNVTAFSYSGANAVATSFTFNGGNSVVGTRTTLDGLGRPILQQTLQGPGVSSYDSVETDYDSVGQVSKQTLPFSAAAGTLCSGTCPGTSFSYDGLGRLTSVTDSAGGSATYTYVKNDVYKSVGPAPAGENQKRRQLEYDSLGRLTSVCEITSAAGSGSCAQTSPQTGYWTKYVYEPLGNMTNVTQNAQSGSTQTRTFAYDLVGRMTSETNPESGAESYFYDTVASGLCAGTYAGDLNKSADAVGNTVCYTYDALHRPTSLTYNGPYATSTPNKYFVYDSATVNSVLMANTLSRLAEAYTATCQGCTKITDLGISYSARGESTDLYEKTPNSGGYYHVTAGYWEHGLVKQISGVPGLTTVNYGVDPEGRPNTVGAASGQSPVTATTYNVASLATQLTLGSLDSDTFTYDPNSFRVTQYAFNVNGQTVTGTLTWNANRTLASLNITDPFDAANTQNCTYGRDDLARSISANCGAAWSQTFAFDVFGNVSKAGSASFQPTYSTSNTNRISSLPGFTPTYDANGNIQTDSFHTYAWNADGGPTSVDSVGLTYDAFGRVVEQNRSGTFTQVLYMPNGEKIALMSGQTLQKAFIALPAGATAVYTSGGLSYYRHPDWEGSSRFASTTARAKYFDVAYAPYGENYADSGTSDLNFTGQNQDTVAGDYDFALREYSVPQGRWVSPDPLGIGAVDPGNPQSWNRYGYVVNDPLDLVDPSGGCGEDAISHGWWGSGWDPSCAGSGFGFQGLSPACGTVMSGGQTGGGYGCDGWAGYGGGGSGFGFSGSLWIGTGGGGGIWNEDPGIPIIYPTIWDLLTPSCSSPGTGFLPGCGFGPGGVPVFSVFKLLDTPQARCVEQANQHFQWALGRGPKPSLMTVLGLSLHDRATEAPLTILELWRRRPITTSAVLSTEAVGLQLRFWTEVVSQAGGHGIAWWQARGTYNQMLNTCKAAFGDSH